MKEVQRLNPPSACECESRNCIGKGTLIALSTRGFEEGCPESLSFYLSDGLVLPKDTYICVVTTSHLQDEVSAPGDFDGFRYYKEAPASESDLYQYSSTDSEHMHFGPGRYACPGRFVASTEIKIILSRILFN